MKRLLGSSILALILALGLASAAFAASAFTDVPDSHWASDYIQQAYENGWVNGVSQSRYAPSDTLTRAQFLKMMATAFYPSELEDATAPNSSPWYAPCWTVAQANGLDAGTSMSRLSDLPSKINRYDMAQVIVNVAESKNVALDASSQDSAISDWNSIPQNYRDAVSAAYALGILNGKNGQFAGQDTMTRAEAAAVLCRMNDVFSGNAPSGGQKPSTPDANTQKPDSQKPDSQKPQTPAATPQDLAAEVVRLVNEERAKAGLSALKTLDSLTRAAEIRAPEIVESFSHTRPDGTKCSTAMDQSGASDEAYYGGENIAAGNATAAATMEQWMNSPGHRANILQEGITHIGVGYVKSSGGYGHYWVQMFATIKDTAQTPGSQKPNTDTQKPETGTQDPNTGVQTPSATPQDLAAEVVRLVNEERAKAGLSALGTYDSLTRAAETRAPEIVTLFSHDRPDGRSCFTALDETGASKNAYTYGENIAAGNATAAATVEQWMNSPGHRANILNKDFTHIGVGYANSSSGYGHYWVQMFVGSRSVPDSGSTQNPGTQNPGTQTPGTQNPGTQTPGTQNPGTQDPGSQGTENGVYFTRPVITLTTNQMCLLTPVDGNFRSVSDVTYTNETPDLLRLSGNSITTLNQTGTGYVTATRNGHTARQTFRIIPLADQINLSCLSTTLGLNGSGTTELYIFKTCKYYGQSVQVEWSTDRPDLITLEERTSSSGNPSVRFTATGTAGTAQVVCRVTGMDGSTSYETCYIHIR